MKITNIKLVVITAFAISLLLMGCNEEVYDGAYKPSLESHYLSVYPRDFEFGNGEETKTGSVTSENAWSFTSVPSWLSLSPSNGNSDADFTIASKTNESVSNREAVFYVSTNSTTSKIQRTLTASQTGSSPYITFPEYGTSTITIEGKSDYLIIDVNSNIPDLTATFSQSWASASYNSEAKTVNVEIQANETNSSRNGILTVSSSQYSKTAKLTISQLASGVTVLEGIAMSYDADGGSQTRTIKSDLPWTAQTTYSWIEFSPESGNAGETTMTITALPSYESDKRIGQIYFYFGDTEKKYIGITQVGRYITITPNSLTLTSSEGASDVINIESNIDWEITSYPDWLTIDKLNGKSGKSTIKITAKNNNSLNSRSGTILIKDSNSGGVQKSISVKQDGINLDEQSLEFGWNASSQSLYVPIPNNWIAAVSESWISLSEYSGSGNTNITVVVDKNVTESLRRGIINFTSDGKTIPITVLQQGQYINIGSNSGEFDAMGGILELSVNSSFETNYEIEYLTDSHDWIAISKIENGYSITTDFNNSIKERNANFVLKAIEDDANEEYIQGVKYQIIQNGRKISTNVSEIIMVTSAATSNTFSITSDGDYELTKGENDFWYSLVEDKIAKSFYIVTTTNTTGQQRSGNLILRLQKLPSNEESPIINIPIVQKYQGVNLNIDDFGPDENWN